MFWGVSWYVTYTIGANTITISKSQHGIGRMGDGGMKGRLVITHMITIVTKNIKGGVRYPYIKSPAASNE